MSVVDLCSPSFSVPSVLFRPTEERFSATAFIVSLFARDVIDHITTAAIPDLDRDEIVDQAASHGSSRSSINPPLDDAPSSTAVRDCQTSEDDRRGAATARGSFSRPVAGVQIAGSGAPRSVPLLSFGAPSAGDVGRGVTRDARQPHERREKRQLVIR